MCKLENDSGRSRPNVSLTETGAFEQQGFSCGFGKRVGKAVSEIELSRMSTAFAKVAVGIARYSGLTLGYRLDD